MNYFALIGIGCVLVWALVTALGDLVEWLAPTHERGEFRNLARNSRGRRTQGQ